MCIFIYSKWLCIREKQKGVTMKTIKITNMDRFVCAAIGVQKFVKAERKIINNCYVDDITINIPLNQLDSFKDLCIKQKNKFLKMPTNTVGNNVGFRVSDKRQTLSTLNKLIKEVV